MEDLDRLSETVEEFCQFIVKLPETKLVEQEWGPKEAPAPLVYHHECYTVQIRAILSGNSFTLPNGRFKDLNAKALNDFRRIPASDLISRLQRANQQLITLASKCNPKEISMQIKEGSKPWRLADLIPAFEAHIRNHQKELRVRLKKEMLK